MKLTDFDYQYPEELVAQHPLERRDASKMMVLDRARGTNHHSNISKLPDFLKEGDLLVVNNSKVFPARLFGEKPTGGKVEVLLLESKDAEKATWSCITTKTARLKDGVELKFSDDLTGRIVEKGLIRFSGDLDKILKVGIPPLPPYIKREQLDPSREEDIRRYQTVYASNTGSAAAPTAGLHFTDKLLAAIKDRGVDIAHVTLHVGLDTFSPVRVDTIEDHEIHGEHFSITASTADAINRAKKDGRRVIAVGTTSVRTLESATIDGEIRTLDGYSKLFIYPGYHFQVVDAMLTNFHQPCSTLIMLVSAFAGRERIMDAYREAIEKKYRLFSYGDCMLIV